MGLDFDDRAAIDFSNLELWLDSIKISLIP
jgi:hypothetical protein